MFEIGRVCMKIAGRDAGKVCVIVDNINEKYVLVDGQTRRRKCNITHLELTDKVLKIDKNAANAAIVKALQEVGIDCQEKKESTKKTSTRPKKQKKVKKAESPQSDKSDEKKTKPAKKKDDKSETEKSVTKQKSANQTS